MKKLFLLLCMTAGSVAYAQLPFTYYEPTITDPQFQQQYQQERERRQPQIQTTYGYLSTNTGLKRTRIKVAVTYTGEVYLNSYAMDINGMVHWFSCNTNAFRVTKYSDGDYIYNNFDYKASTLNGSIYF